MNKKIIILRHGQATPPGAGDHSRALTPTGKQQIAAAASALSDIPIEAVLVSDSQRTQDSWAVFQNSLDKLPEHIVITSSLYLAGHSQVLQEVAVIPDEVNHLLVIGHNPGWSEMISLLSGEYCGLGTGEGAVLEYATNLDWVMALSEIGAWNLLKQV